MRRCFNTRVNTNHLKDKNICITWEQLMKLVDILADKIIRKYGKDRFTHVYGIPRGGCIIAVLLSHKLGLKYGLYKYDKRKQLIVDDVCDTGFTIRNYVYAGYEVSTLYFSQQSVVEPSVYVEEKSGAEWLVFPWEDLSAEKIELDKENYTKSRAFRTYYMKPGLVR